MSAPAEEMPRNPRKTTSVRELGQVDVTALRRAVSAIGEDQWRAENAGKPNKFGVLEQTRHMVFRFPDSPFDWRRFHDRPGWSRWRGLIEPALTEAVRPYGYARGAFPRIMFADMPPGAVIHPHIDDKPAARWPHKIHVPLFTNEAVTAFFGGAERHMPVGHALEVDNLSLHWVRNGGATHRIHLIFEFYDLDQPDPNWLEPLLLASAAR